MYNNHTSENKQICRDLVEEFVQQQIKFRYGNVDVFTLPSTNFVLEKSLLNHKQVKLTCAEKDNTIYKAQQLIYKHELNNNKNIQLYRGDAFDLITCLNRKYDVIWLDLCSNLSPLLVNNLKSLLKSNKLKEDSYVIITIFRGREYYSKTLPKLYGCRDMNHFRDCLPTILNASSSIKRRECKLIKRFDYMDKSPMTMYSFKLSNI